MPIGLRWQKGNVVCGRAADNIQTGHIFKNPLLNISGRYNSTESFEKNHLHRKSNVVLQDSFRPNI